MTATWKNKSANINGLVCDGRMLYPLDHGRAADNPRRQTMTIEFWSPVALRGFVSRRIPGGSGTWTLTTWLGQFLLRAEEIAGPRDKAWTPIGIEFFEEGDGKPNRPHIWFPGNCQNVAIRLTLDAAEDPGRALWQLAHEVAHLLSPCRAEEVTNLEEGFACNFARDMAGKYAYYSCQVSEDYRAAYGDVMSLLAMSTTAIKEVRRIEPQFSRITPDMIKRVVPRIEDQLAERLCRSWST
jgi:hypothetical protein